MLYNFEEKIIEWYNKYRGLFHKSLNAWIKFLKETYREISTYSLEKEIDNIVYTYNMKEIFASERPFYSLEDFIFDVVYNISMRYFPDDLAIIDSEIDRIAFISPDMRVFIYEGVRRELAHDVLEILVELSKGELGFFEVIVAFKRVYDKYM